ncbi:MAG TPA: FtsX-like permease family protein [Candidatus Eisenbacteria bacterium]|nr:FtsX-like permease family protein [Candidatus Eisenbacteria bacterium]
MRIHPLHRKLWRDVWHYRGQLAAIVAVVTCGIALFVAMRSMNGYLRDSRDRYYAQYRFADVFAQVRRAPARVAREVSTLPGVAAVDDRIVFDVVADVPGLAEPAVAHLVSIRVPRAPALNDVHLTAGRWPAADRNDEVVASRAFAGANGLRPGDSVGAVMNGRWQRLRIVGVGVSPEFVYEIGGTSIFPDNRRYGVLWVGREALETAFDLQGAFNDLAVRVAPGASKTQVLLDVDRAIERYGGIGAYGREDQLSDQFLEGEIDETQVTSTILPGIFLAVTAFLLNLVLSRLVGTQRDQIATLKAFGYSNAAIGIHYFELALVPLLAGVVLGSALGLVLAGQLAAVYARFFQFPWVEFVPDWSIVAAAAAIGVAAGVAGSVSSVARSVSLPPAAAMQAEAPARFRHGLFERFTFLSKPSPQRRIIGRNLERWPARTLFSIVGLALAGGLVITVQSMFDAVNYMKTLQFYGSDRADVTVLFRDARRASALPALERLPGVIDAEGFRVAPVRLRAGGRSERTVMYGLAPDVELRRVVDMHGKVDPIPPDGCLLSATIARKLGVGRGDRVSVELLDGARPTREVVVAATTEEALGSAAYMSLDALRAMERGDRVYSGAFLRTDGRLTDHLYLALKRLPAVSGVSVREVALRSFDETIAESFGISLAITLIFACVIAFGIVYNSARVALSERGRELASLRVLGFTRREVTWMLLGEQGILLALSIPLAFLTAYGLGVLISVAFESDLYRIPMVVNPASYLFGAGIVTLAAALSGLIVSRRIDGLDLVAVLKTRE